MVKFSHKNKEMLNEIQKGMLMTGSGLVLGTALVATAGTGAAGIAIAGGAIAVLTTKKHLSAGFKAGLKRWQQKDNLPLSLRAKLLKFRNAISAGMATAHKSLEKENMARNPFLKSAYEKATKEGRKVKISERLKAMIQFSALRHGTMAINKAALNKILTSSRQQRR